MRQTAYFLITWCCLLVAGCGQRHEASEPSWEAGPTDTLPGEIPCAMMYGICTDDFTVEERQIRPGETLSVILSRYGLSSSDVQKLVQQAGSMLDVRQLRAGQTYAAMCTADSTASLRYWIYERDRTHFVVCDFTGDSLCVSEGRKEVTLRRRRIAAPIIGSLWLTVNRNGFNSGLSDKLSDIFAWQVDFFGIAAGDSICAVFDETVLDTTVIGISEVYGACFRHAGKDYYAIPFMQDDSIRSYFDENGQSLRKAFLKAPLKYSRISSTFSNSRYHPVLKRYRAHHGVDYAAPSGTPVHSIGDGMVTKRAYERNGGGNYLTIKHNATYSTTYMHLSRFASGIQTGSRVTQGQVIGYVGSTGLSTGPHLDFRVYKNGTAINPLTMESPPTEPVKAEYATQFSAVRDSVLQLLKEAF